MRLRDLLYETFTAIRANRVRSLLTVLGIVIGIAAVITMTALIVRLGGLVLQRQGHQRHEVARHRAARRMRRELLHRRGVQAHERAPPHR